MMDFSEICLTLTTGITYILYPKDKHDRMLASAMNAYNRISGKTDYSYSIQEFHTVIGMNREIISMINDLEHNDDDEAVIQINSIIFLYSILDTYPNLKKLSFEFSNEDFDRITKDEIGNKEDIFNFQIFITDIVFDSTTFFSKELVEVFNKELIKLGIISNSYLNRSPYVYIKWKEMKDIFANISAYSLDVQESEYWSRFVIQLNSFFGEDKADETNILYITDYILY